MKWLTELLKQYREELEWYRGWGGYEQFVVGEQTIESGPEPELGWVYMMALKSLIQKSVLIRLCSRWTEHEGWIDEGYGTPDTGCDAGHCPICGWGFHVTLY